MTDVLNISRTGLNASKKSIETTGHNIANVNTEGYSRQRVVQTTSTPINKQGLIQGTGTRIVSVERTHDPFVEKRLQQNTADSMFYETRLKEMSDIENVFNEIDGEGLNNILNRFYNSFRELANQPENETIRSVVRDNARMVVKDFNRIRESLDNLARGIDNKIGMEVESINQTLKNISNLNKRISTLEVGGQATGDLRDQRDTAIRTLSESLRIHTYTDNRNNFIVSAVGVGTLVAGGSYQELGTGGSSKEDSGNGMDGSTEIFFRDRAGQKITSNFKSGTLSSYIKVRNTDIKNLQDTIDEIAYEFANTVNAIHRKGYANRPLEEVPGRGVAAFDPQGATTGIDFFEAPVSKAGAAKNIQLSKEVRDDLSNIVTALNPNSPGDNRVALAISKLQNEKFMAGGTATIEEHFLKTVGTVGMETGKAQIDSEQMKGIQVQTQTLKDRMSGVSLDEEAANLVKFQHAYQASAKVMQTAQEMFDTVLSIKR